LRFHENFGPSADSFVDGQFAGGGMLTLPLAAHSVPRWSSVRQAMLAMPVVS